MRDVSNWQGERQRMIEENRARGQSARIQQMARQLQEEDDLLSREEIRHALRGSDARVASDNRSHESDYSEYTSTSSYYDEEESSGSYYDSEGSDSESQSRPSRQDNMESRSHTEYQNDYEESKDTRLNSSYAINTYKEEESNGNNTSH